MNPKFISLLSWLKDKPSVLITGPRKSGVELLGHILVSEVTRPVIKDDVDDFIRVCDMIKNYPTSFIVNSNFFLSAHHFKLPTVVVVRNPNDIAKDMGIEELTNEMISSHSGFNILPAAKQYNAWNTHIKKNIKNVFEINYEDFISHPCLSSQVVQEVKQNASDIPCGVIIGHFNSTDALILNVGSIRAHCGDIPIMISDDCSDGFGATPPKNSAFDKVLGIAANWNNVFVWPNCSRIGHAGGDLATFWKGIMWGKFNKLEVVFKLSQRCIFDTPRWAQKSALELIKSGRSTLGRDCTFHHWKIRTESIGLKINDWYRPDIMAHLTPRKIGCATENVIWDDIKERLGGSVACWSLMSPARNEKQAGVLFREANTVDEYYQLGRRLGITVDGSLNTVTSPAQPGYVLG